MLPKRAPDWLAEWAEERKWRVQALLWRVDWYREPLTGLRERCARVRCTACGGTFLESYLSGGTCHGGGYPPQLILGNGPAREHSEVRCPECGAAVHVTHLSGATEYAREAAWPMTLERIGTPGATDRLALILWEAYKYHRADGARRIEIRPWEAFIVEEKTIVRCTKHAGLFYSNYSTPDWTQVKRFEDTMRDITETVCPEGIAEAVRGTTAENAKLEIYMQGEGIRFPVSWVRIWQRHRNAETLMTCGAAGIVGNLIGQEKTESRRGYRETYGTRIPALDCVRWKEKRPGRMLGMDRGELREAVALQNRKEIGGRTWRIWLRARASGHPWTLEDLPALERMSRQDRADELFERPERIMRYLDVQNRRWKEDKADDAMLLDYWDMLRKETPGPWDRETQWPERLKREHDRLVKLRLDRESHAMDELFAARAETLRALAYESGGLLIRPPERQSDLTYEGKILHHCVAGYAERHAKGQTAILFVRRAEDPEQPFFTLEWDEKHGEVRQNRGNRNCERTPEVRAFEEEWTAWALAGAPRNKDGTPAKIRKENVA